MWLLWAMLAFPASALLVYAINWLGLIPWRRSVGQHWTERARLLYPTRISAQYNVLFIPINFSLLAYLLLPNSSVPWIAVGSWAGTVLGSYSINRAIQPEYPFRQWLHWVAASWIIYIGMSAIGGLLLIAMPNKFSWKSCVIVAAFLAVNVIWQSGLLLRMDRWFRLIQPASPRLRALVDEVSARMNVPVKAVWESTSFYANAGALPVTRELIFTKKLLETQSDDEIKAVCAHELGHLTEPGGAWWRVALASINVFPLIFLNPLIANFGAQGVVMMIAVMLLIRWLRVLWGRRMEKRSDRLAAENSAEQAFYANALEHLYEINSMPATMPGRSRRVHPDLYDRMTAVGVTPTYPRPKRAKRFTIVGLLMMMICGALVGISCAKFFSVVTPSK
jgi:Zn-dependent protease with chaperone function